MTNNQNIVHCDEKDQNLTVSVIEWMVINCYTKFCTKSLVIKSFKTTIITSIASMSSNTLKNVPIITPL